LDPGTVQHYFFFEGLGAAEKLAKTLRKAGHEVAEIREVESPPPNWIVVVTDKDPVGTPGLLDQRWEEFEPLADRLEGVYDGYDVTVADVESDESKPITFGADHQIVSVLPPRHLTPIEESVLSHLFSVAFPGRDQLITQASHATVSVECLTCPTIEFSIPTSLPQAPVVRRVPVEAALPDERTGGTHILLHVQDGFLRELEIFRGDGSRVSEIPDPAVLEVITLPTKA
jgi:regulator of RNase E activity RraB